MSLRVAGYRFVGDNSEEQHGTQEELKPIWVPAGVHNSLAGHAKNQGTNGSTNSSSFTASQGTTTDNGSNDVQEFITNALTRLNRVKGEKVVHQVANPTNMKRIIFTLRTGTPTA